MLCSANFEHLGECAVVGTVRVEPLLDTDVVAELVLYVYSCFDVNVCVSYVRKLNF
jgi:hypothetical protein